MNVAKIDGTALTSDELVSWLKLTGRFGHVVQDMIQDKLTAAAAKRQGIEASNDELQDAADEHRRAHGLHRVADANDFLAAAETSLDGYERFIEDSVLAGKMFERISCDEAVEAHFAQNAPQFDTIELGHIVVDSEDKANEIHAILTEDPGAFQQLAREESLAGTAEDGGRIGRVLRGSLTPDLEAKAFAAAVGAPIGPFKVEAHHFEVFVVLSRQDAELTDSNKDLIRKQLFDRWLDEAAREFGVEA